MLCSLPTVLSRCFVFCVFPCVGCVSVMCFILCSDSNHPGRLQIIRAKKKRRKKDKGGSYCGPTPSAPAETHTRSPGVCVRQAKHAHTRSLAAHPTPWRRLAAATTRPPTPSPPPWPPSPPSSTSPTRWRPSTWWVLCLRLRDSWRGGVERRRRWVCRLQARWRHPCRHPLLSPPSRCPHPQPLTPPEPSSRCRRRRPSLRARPRDEPGCWGARRPRSGATACRAPPGCPRCGRQ